MSAVNEFREQRVDVAGVAARVLIRGEPGAPAALFLHGGIPGVTPYCSGAHIWGDCLTRFQNRVVIAPDLPGSGGTMPGSEPLTMDVLGHHVMAMISALSLESVDIVGHDLGGLLGLWVALTSPTRVRSLSIVASPMSPPTADGFDPILFTSLPQPLWSRDSQAWALERLSFVHTHVDAQLLDECVTASQDEPHRHAVEHMERNFAGVFSPSVARVRHRLWAACRNDGLAVPTQVVWASHDPATSIESGRVLFEAIASRQRATQMHIINRSGSFPFREQGDAFHYIVASFADGVSKGGT